MTKNYDNICFVFLRVVYYSNISRRINRVSDYVYLWGGSSYYRQFFCRLTLYYTIEKYFLSTFFQTFLISSIHTKTSNQSNFTCGYILMLSGFDFYIFILLNKYITFQALVIWTEKILKKSKKIMKLGCFRLYNILGS